MTRTKISAAGPILPLLALMALASCGEEKAQTDGANAGGKVLPGSISDAMIPYDQVTSSAPAEAPMAASSAAASGGQAEAADSADETASTEETPAAEAPAQPAPAE